MVKIKKISVSDENDLKIFIQNLGSSESSFRYFQKRSLDVISKHLITFLAYENDEPVGYGHLEEENGVNWLGIAVTEKSIGNGIGSKVLDLLIHYAEGKELELRLSVDLSNIKAYKLYQRRKFIEVNLSLPLAIAGSAGGRAPVFR